MTPTGQLHDALQRIRNANLDQKDLASLLVVLRTLEADAGDARAIVERMIVEDHSSSHAPQS